MIDYWTNFMQISDASFTLLPCEKLLNALLNIAFFINCFTLSLRSFFRKIAFHYHHK
jgi:hypothetical protein